MNNNDQIEFILKFAQTGQLDTTIKDLTKTNKLLQANLKLQEQLGASDGISKAVADYNRLTNSINSANKSLTQTNDAAKIVALSAEISKLRKEMEALGKVAKQNKQTTDSETEAILRSREALNAKKKAIRESIKDETALTVAIDKQVRSIQELQDKNNALIRQRKIVDQTTEAGKKKYDQLTAAINKNNATLKAQDAAIGSHVRNVGNYSSATANLEKGMNRIGNSVKLLGVGMVAGMFNLTGIIQNAGQVMEQNVKKFASFDEALKDLQAITGLSTEELEFFRKEAFEVGTTTRVSANEYITAIKLMGSAIPSLLKNKVALADVTRQAIALSDATGQDLPSSISDLAQTLNAMELPATDAARVVNVLAAASQLGAKEVPFVTAALSKFGGVAASAGVSIEESAAAIEILGAKIPQAETVGTGLRNVIIELQTAAQKQGREFKGLGAELDLLAPKVNDVAFLEKQFGKENILVAQTLIKQRDALGELTEQVTGTDIAYKQAIINNQSLAAQMQILENKSEALTIQWGERMAPAMLKQKAAGQAFDEWFFDAYPKFIELNKDLAGAFGVNVDAITDFFTAGQRLSIQQEFAKGLTGELATQAEILKTRYEEGTISIEEYISALAGTNKTQAQFNDLTKASQEEIKGLVNQLNEGKLSWSDYLYEIQKVVRLEERRKPSIDGFINALKSEDVALDDNTLATDRNAEAIKRAREEKEKQKKAWDDYFESVLRESKLIQEMEKSTETPLEDIEKKRVELKTKQEVDYNKLREEALKKRELDLRYQGKTEKEIADDLLAYKISLLETEILARKAAGEKTLDQELELARLQKQQTEENQKEIRESIQETIQFAMDAYEKAAEMAIEKSQEELNEQNKNVEAQRELAAQGLENTLAFEKELAAEKEKQLIEAQKRLEKIKKIEAYYNLVAAYAENDPNTAPAKALVQMGIAEAIAGTFKDGGIVDEEVAKQGGQLPGSGRDSILIEAHGKEGILTEKEMNKLGRDGFHALRESLKNGVDVFANQNDSVVKMITSPRQMIDISPIERKLDKVVRAVENIPETKFFLDQSGNLITTQEAKTWAKTLVQKRKKGFNG